MEQTTHPTVLAGPAASMKPKFIARRWVQLLGVGLVALFIGTAVGGASGSTTATTPNSDALKVSYSKGYAEGIAQGKESGIAQGEVQGKAAAEKSLADDRAALLAAQAAVTAREAKISGAEKAAKASTITEGTWTVGADIKAGTYRVSQAVTADAGCYWEIDKSGTNGEDIVANDNVSGGRPTVTLRAGQDFTTSDCGDWAKIG